MDWQLEDEVSPWQGGKDRWAWAYRVWCSAGLVLLASALARFHRQASDPERGEAWPLDTCERLGVTPQRMAQAVAVSEGRAHLLPTAGGWTDNVGEAKTLVVSVAFLLRALPPCLRVVVLPVVLRRLVCLLPDASMLGFEHLRISVTKPVTEVLRVMLRERTRPERGGEGGASATAAEVHDEVVRLGKVLGRALAVAMAGRWAQLGPSLACLFPVDTLAQLVRADRDTRSDIVTWIRSAAAEGLSPERIRVRSKRLFAVVLEEVGAPDDAREPYSGPSLTTLEARRQRLVVAQADDLDESTRAAGLTLAWVAVPLSLLPGCADRSDSRLIPWRPGADWWRRARAHTERAGDRVIPALRARLWPIQAAGS